MCVKSESSLNMELEGGEEFVMVETSGVSMGVSDNSRTSACFREHLHFHVPVVCDVLEGSHRFQFLHVVAVNLRRPICFKCCHRAAPQHNIAKRELWCLKSMLAITLI